ncbi:MAG TPA: hypothetical protein VFK13_04200 [Gemmatimonadaceae bacterium]|nr:hypothetical protein [Gemmatimonadaceae bacterium]
MARKHGRDERARSRGRDSELDRELQREGREGGGLVGDTAEDRNLSGSSTYETLPDEDDAENASGGGSDRTPPRRK